jgi:hypothetical protein
MSVLFGCSYLFHAPFAIRVMVTSSFLSPTGTSAGIRLGPSPKLDGDSYSHPHPRIIERYVTTAAKLG